MENETELEEAKRRLDDAEADKYDARERLTRYEASNPGEYGSTFETLCRVVAETTSRLNALESNRNQRLRGICILT